MIVEISDENVALLKEKRIAMLEEIRKYNFQRISALSESVRIITDVLLGDYDSEKDYTVNDVERYKPKEKKEDEKPSTVPMVPAEEGEN